MTDAECPLHMASAEGAGPDRSVGEQPTPEHTPHALTLQERVERLEGALADTAEALTHLTQLMTPFLTE